MVECVCRRGNQVILFLKRNKFHGVAQLQVKDFKTQRFGAVKGQDNIQKR